MDMFVINKSMFVGLSVVTLVAVVIAHALAGRRVLRLNRELDQARGLMRERGEGGQATTSTSPALSLPCGGESDHLLPNRGKETEETVPREGEGTDPPPRGGVVAIEVVVVNTTETERIDEEGAEAGEREK